MTCPVGSGPFASRSPDTVDDDTAFYQNDPVRGVCGTFCPHSDDLGPSNHLLTFCVCFSPGPLIRRRQELTLVVVNCKARNYQMCILVTRASFVPFRPWKSIHLLFTLATFA